MKAEYLVRYPGDGFLCTFCPLLCEAPPTLALLAQVRVPKEVSDEEAAQFLVNPVTAYGCMPGSIRRAMHCSCLQRLRHGSLCLRTWIACTVARQDWT